MKKHIKLILALFILAVFCSVGIATYTAWTAITDVTITFPANNQEIIVGSYVPLTCTTSTDNDCNNGQPEEDTVTHTWSAGAGSFSPGNVGTSSVVWTAPGTIGDVDITVTADDSPLADDTAKTDTVTIHVVPGCPGYPELEELSSVCGVFTDSDNFVADGGWGGGTTCTEDHTVYCGMSTKFTVEDGRGYDNNLTLCYPTVNPSAQSGSVSFSITPGDGVSGSMGVTFGIKAKVETKDSFVDIGSITLNGTTIARVSGRGYGGYCGMETVTSESNQTLQVGQTYNVEFDANTGDGAYHTGSYYWFYIEYNSGGLKVLATE